MLFRLCWLLLAVFLASCSGGSDSEESTSYSTFHFPVVTPRPDNSHITPVPAPDRIYFSYTASESMALPVSEKPTSKAQTIRLKGSTIAFTATAGHLIADDWASAPAKPANLTNVDAEAAIFYTAYTRDDLPHDQQPVTFIFNGPPGGGSAALDLDFLGPKSFDADASSTADSLPIKNNPNTLLDRTDLVFVDPVGTGYSGAIQPHKNSDFWGVDSDAKVLRDFITRYINTNNRQSSPKYIYGVSYGGIRAPIIARLLIESGTRDYVADPSNKPTNILSGLILNSPVLDEKTDCYLFYAACGGALPTMR
jgi:carboxypeptidase C (cathepsin A)